MSQHRKYECEQTRTRRRGRRKRRKENKREHIVRAMRSPTIVVQTSLLKTGINQASERERECH